MFSSGQAASPQPLRISPSMPTSPNSLTMTASRRPLRIGQHVADQRGLAGAEEAGDDGAGHARERGRHHASPVKSNGGMRAIEPALQGFRPAAPRHQCRRALREQLRAFDQAPAPAGGIEAAEHIGPGAVAAHRRAQAPVAVGEAADRPHRDAGPRGGLCGRLRQHLARNRHQIERPPAPAGDADIDRDGGCGLSGLYLSPLGRGRNGRVSGHSG